MAKLHFRRRNSDEAGQRRAERSREQRAEHREPRLTNDIDDDEEMEIAAPPPRNAERRAAPVVTKPAKAKPRKSPDKQGLLDLTPNERYALPALDLLHKAPVTYGQQRINDDSLQKNARLLETVLDDFGVKGEAAGAPARWSRCRIEPAPGTKTSRAVGLATMWRAQHECGVRAHRRGARPQRYRHRTA
jgi:S-DNA-T family DNA segregation ATPase FtsK/SpoIIIE